MRKWEYGSTPCPTCNMCLTAFLLLTDDELPRQLCSRRRHLPLFLRELRETCLIIPLPSYSTKEQVGANGGPQTGALPATLGPQTTGTTSITGRLPDGLLRDVRIHFQTWIFKTYNIFPASSGSGIIAKETGAATSAFLFLYWMKHELKTGRWQTTEESSMEK